MSEQLLIKKTALQEGYDADLLNLQPRTGEADAAAALADPEKGLEPRVNLAPGTYESRSKSDPTARRHRRRKVVPERKWWQKPVALVGPLVFLVVVGLAVGLGVGLGTKKSHKNSSSGIPSITSIQPTISQIPSIDLSASGAGGNTATSAFSIGIVPTSAASAVPQSAAAGRMRAKARARVEVITQEGALRG